MKIEIDEGERQLILMALAHLSLEKPGFDYALNEIAIKMDNLRRDRVAPRGVLYDEFRRLA